MEVLPNKTYRIAYGTPVTLDENLMYQDAGIQYDKNGKCLCGQFDCIWDIVSEVDNNIYTSGVKFGAPLAYEVGVEYDTSNKQNLFELTLNIPQDAETFALTKKVEVNGISYLAKIELEKV